MGEDFRDVTCEYMGTQPFICSDHFSTEAFYYKRQGQGFQQCLKPVTEVPQVCTVFDQTTAEPTSGDTMPSSSGANMLGSPSSRILEVSPTKSTDSVSHMFNTPSPVRKRISREDEENVDAPVNLEENSDTLSCSSRTLTASSSTTTAAAEVEEFLSYPSTSKVERKKYYRYAGDLDSDDFSSPTRAQRSWRVAKRTISMLRAKVTNLQKSRSYYKNRCTSLQKLLSYLESRNFISTGAKQNIQYSTYKFKKALCISNSDYIFGRLLDIKKYISSLKYAGRNKNLVHVLINSSFRNLPADIMNYFGSHFLDFEPLSTHFTDLLKLILKKYFNIRIHHETRKRLDNNIGNRVRSMLTKTILFKNQ
nr:unnamed protein product [Callosobruchus analis]